jgi:hypothetical protein
MIFWFVIKPENNADTIKTIVTSMTAVLTTTMTLRIILSVRGSLIAGGMFAGAWSTTTGTGGTRSGTAHHGASILQISSAAGAPTYTLDGMGQKKAAAMNPAASPWTGMHDDDMDAGANKALESKEARSIVDEPGLNNVHVTVHRETVRHDDE